MGFSRSYLIVCQGFYDTQLRERLVRRYKPNFQKPLCYYRIPPKYTRCENRKKAREILFMCSARNSEDHTNARQTITDLRAFIKIPGNVLAVRNIGKSSRRRRLAKQTTAEQANHTPKRTIASSRYDYTRTIIFGRTKIRDFIYPLN